MSAHGFVCYCHVVLALVAAASIQQPRLDVQSLFDDLKRLSDGSNTPILQVEQ